MTYRQCAECKKCNRKNKPSVLKYSLYCDNHYIGIKRITKSSIFRLILNRLTKLREIKDFMFEKRYDEKKGLNTKGFRKNYFNGE